MVGKKLTGKKMSGENIREKLPFFICFKRENEKKEKIYVWLTPKLSSSSSGK